LPHGRHLSPVRKTRKRRGPRQRRGVIEHASNGSRRKPISVNVSTRRARFHLRSTSSSLLVIRDGKQCSSIE
jgi:hypothetical protein